MTSLTKLSEKGKTLSLSSLPSSKGAQISLFENYYSGAPENSNLRT